MITMVDWKVYADLVTAGATVAIATISFFALRYAKGQLQETKQEARVLHLVKLAEQFDGPLIASARKGLANQRVVNGALVELDVAAPPPHADEVLNFFEHISMLEEKGLLDAEQVWSEFAYWMLNTYADLRDLIKEYQKKIDPTFYQNFEKLAAKLASIEKARGGSYAAPGRPDIKEFYEYELRILGSRQKSK